MQLGTFDANISHFNPGNPYSGDERIPIQFYMGTTPDNAATETAGYPKFKDEEYIRIFNSKDNIIDRPVRVTDKQRWPRQYQAWKLTGESEPGAAGLKLEAWPQITRAQAEEFKYFKVYTVEQLAELPDSIAGGINGIQRLKALAKAHLETARGELPLLKMQMELEARDGQINELTAAVRNLSEQLTELTKKVA